MIAVVVILAGSGGAAIASAVETVLIVLGSVIGLAVAGVVGLLVHRARQDRPGRPIAAPVMYQLPPEPRPRLEEPSKPAIEPSREIHVHIHVADATQAAAIIRTALPGPSGDAETGRNEP